MAKRRKNGNRAKTRLTTDRVVSEAKNVGLLVLGMAAGAKLSEAVTRQSAGVTGLDGPSVRITGPSVAAATGLVIAATSKNEMTQQLGYGMAAVGGAQMLQEFTGLRITPAPKSGLGYTMQELPEPTVSGLLEAAPAYVDDEGNAYDENGNAINGLDAAPAYVDDEGNAYDANGNPIDGLDDAPAYVDDEGNAYDANGNPIDGVGDLDGARYMYDQQGNPIAVEGTVDGQRVWLDADGNVVGRVEGVDGDVDDVQISTIPGLGDIPTDPNAPLPGLGNSTSYGYGYGLSDVDYTYQQEDEL